MRALGSSRTAVLGALAALGTATVTAFASANREAPATVRAITTVQSPAPTVEPKPVPLPHDWRVGTRYHVEHTRTRESFRDGTEPVTSFTTTPVEVEVLARRSDGYTVRWTYGKPNASTPSGVSAVLSEAVVGLVTGLVTDMTTDATGSIVGLADSAAVERHFADASRRVIASLRASGGATDEQLTAIAATTSRMKGDALAAAYLPAPKAFYMPSGAALVPGVRRTYEDRLPNPFGGDPLPSVASLELRDVKLDARRATVEWRHTIDPTKAGPILEASIRAFAKKNGQELPAEAALSFDAIEDAATYVYDLDTGVPIRVVTTRSTSMAGTRQIETNLFTTSAYRYEPPTPASK